MAAEIKHIECYELRNMKDKEGLIIQGCGGDLNEWTDGINEMLTDSGILADGTKFTEVYEFQNDGLTCLMFPFDDNVKLAVGKLAVWRLQTHEQFGGTWLLDYVPNRLGGFVGQDKCEDIVQEQTM